MKIALKSPHPRRFLVKMKGSRFLIVVLFSSKRERLVFTDTWKMSRDCTAIVSMKYERTDLDKRRREHA